MAAASMCMTWAARWLAAGPRLVVFTRGDSGAIAFFGETALEMPGRKVDVIDTVGAGDTFHAARLVALDEQQLLHPDPIGQASLATIARPAFRHRGLVDHLLAAGRGFADARRRRSDHRMEQYVTVRQVSPVDFTAFRVAEGLAERQPFPGLYGRDQGGRWRGADGKLSRPGGPREPPGARTLSLLFHGAGSSR
jgi:hypothetical protein